MNTFFSCLSSFYSNELVPAHPQEVINSVFLKYHYEFVDLNIFGFECFVILILIKLQIVPVWQVEVGSVVVSSLSGMSNGLRIFQCCFNVYLLD